MSGESHQLGFRAALQDERGAPAPIDGDRLGYLRLIGGQLDGSIHTELRWSGQISCLNSTPPGGWDRYQIRISADVRQDGGPLRSVTLGTFIPATSQVARDGRPAELELYSPLLRLRDYLTTETVSVPPKTPILPAAWRFAWEAGVNSDIGIGIPGLGPEMREAQVWPAGTSHLRIVNDLLATAGWMSADVTPTGWVTSTPWQPPAQRGVAHTFRAGPEALHAADWVEEQDLFLVPNRVICTTMGGEQPAMSAFADNNDPSSPTSIPARGGRVKAVTEDHEAANQAALQAIANRRIVTMSQKVRNIPLKHIFIPGVTLNSVTQLIGDDINERCVLTTQTIPLRYDALVESGLRVVVS